MTTSLGSNIWACVRPYRLRFIGALAQVVLLSGIELLKPWPLKVVIDNALGGKPLILPGFAFLSSLPPLTLVGLACVALFLIYLFSGAATVLYFWMAIGLGQRMVHDLRLRVYAHLQRLSLAFHSRQKVGDLMMRVTADSFAVQTMVMNGILPILQAVTLLIGMVAILFPINLTLTLVLLSIAPGLAYLIILSSERIDRIATLARDADSRVYSLVHWGMAAIKHIQAFAKEDAEHRRFTEASGAALHRHRLLYTWQTIYSSLVTLLMAAGMGLVLYAGAREVIHARLSLGQLMVFSAYVAQLYAPVNQVAQSWGLIAGSRVGAKRCFEILEAEEDLKDGTHTFPKEGAKGHVEWRAVRFHYRPETPVLRHVDLIVEPGETVALVGATGAGKSTMLGLLSRFFDPSEGQVLVDGLDVREYQLKCLRSQIAMVLQPPLIFPLSVHDNIAYGRDDASLDSVREAARLARVDHMIEALPYGYETIVDDGGATFSEGEKQRLAIARAILRSAPILIFDEPTSALDAATEAEIMAGLASLAAGRTTFIIAHRLSTIRNADKIVLLKDGIIAEAGTFSELIQKRGLFANLYQAQFENAIDYANAMANT